MWRILTDAENLFVQGTVEGEWERRGGKGETENFEKKTVLFPHRWRLLAPSSTKQQACPPDLAGAASRVEEDVEKCRGGVAEIEDGVALVS